MVKSERGFAPLLIVVVITVVGAIGLFAYLTLSSNDSPVKKSTQVADCGGKFFDSHTHLDNPELPIKLAQRMQENSVSCAAIFVQLNPDSYQNDYEMLQDDLGGTPNVYLPFFDIVRNHQTEITTSYLQKVYDEFEGRFVGFGEFALYRSELSGTDLTKEPWVTIFDFAGKNNLFVMIHLGIEGSDRDNLETMLDKYPNTKVIIHGFEQGGSGFAELLKNHPNLYFTLDTATLMKLGAEGPGLHLMYPNGQGSAKKFLKEYAQNKDILMEQARNEYLQVIMAAPDRVMWGTDASMDWHTDEQVYAKLIEFSNEFVAMLPADIQSKYVYKNAIGLLGEKAMAFEQLGFDDDQDDIDH